MTTISEDGSLHDLHSSGTRLRACSGSTASKVTFFDLPREIRDQIYELVLVQEIPMDFAPIKRGVHYKYQYEYRDEYHGCGGWHQDQGPLWYQYRYDQVIAPSVQILKANKQIHAEATPVFYSQPFRFSSQADWIVLEAWLKRIGPQNAQFLKDITICHPAWSREPTNVYDMNQFVSTYRNRFGIMIRKISLPDPADGINGRNILFNGSEDHDKMLGIMPGLQNLRLLLHMANFEQLWERNIETYSFSITNHAVRQVPKAQVEVLHLVDVRPELRVFFNELTIEDLESNPDPTQHRLARMRTVLAFHAQHNIPVREIYHDLHSYYPVKIKGDCVNKDLCDHTCIW